MSLPKIIVILGPTASGKTDLSLKLAEKFNGEIVSADSRQVYKKMNIGTAKPKADFKSGAYMVEGVPHYMMDIIDPDDDFSLAVYKTMALKSIKDILRKKKLPIVAGGTGLYIRMLVDNLDIPPVESNKQLRKQLEKKKLLELAAMLVKMDPATAKKIDLQNPRRVLRALEVFISSGQSFFKQSAKSKPLFEFLQIGLNLSSEELGSKINARADKQIEDGLVDETKKLAKKYSWDLPSMSGIGYRQIGFYLRGEATLEEAVDILKRDTRRYAKRQMTWFKRDKRIVWIKNTNLALAEKLVKKFLA